MFLYLVLSRNVSTILCTYLGQFVVNIMSTWYVDSANYCCGNFPPEVNEMEIAGLTELKSDIVKPPRVGESAIHLECEVRTLGS